LSTHSHTHTHTHTLTHTHTHTHTHLLSMPDARLELQSRRDRVIPLRQAPASAPCTSPPSTLRRREDAQIRGTKLVRNLKLVVLKY